MYEVKRKVGHSCVGLDGRVKTVSILDFIQDCTLFHLESIKAIDEYFKQNNVGMYVAYRQLDILKRPEYRQTVTIKTMPHEMNSMYGYRCTGMFDENGELLVCTNEIGVFVNLSTGRPFRAPKTLLEAMPLEKPIAGIKYFGRKVKAPETEPVLADCVKIRAYHCDGYGHVNNAKYIEIADEYLPAYFDAKRIRVEYKIAAKKDMVLQIRTYNYGKIFAVEMIDEEEREYAIVEYLKR